MIGVALRGLLGRKLRSVLTAFAIVLGVAMISGSFVLTDTIGKTIDGVYEESYAEADAVISSKHAIKTEEGDKEKPPFAAGVLSEVRELPGVRTAAGEISDTTTLVDHKGKPIGEAETGTGAGVDAATGTSLSPLSLAAGEWPRGDGQIAIDKSTADDEQFKLGDRIGGIRRRSGAEVRDHRPRPLRRARLAGRWDDRRLRHADGRKLFDKQGKLDQILVGAKPGVSEAELVRQIDPLLTETTAVQTATAQAKSESQDSQDGMGIFRMILLAFGGIALFVGSFVIANTLSITVAQRMRELATLRTLGASRKQVLASVMLESVVVGAIASVVGLFAGLGIAKGLYALLAATGSTSPRRPLVLVPPHGARQHRRRHPDRAPGEPATGDSRHAYRADRRGSRGCGHARVPVRALRAAGFAGRLRASPSGCSRYGSFASGLDTKVRLISLAGGVLLLFVGVAMVAQRVVRPLASILGMPGARIGGSAGKLARQNAMRNPARTASTAAAIMIGLSLITFVAVLGQGLRSSFTSAVDELFVADYNVLGGDNPLSNKAAPAVAKAPGVEAVSEIREGEAKHRQQVHRGHGRGREPDEGRGHDLVERLQQRSRATGE